MITGKEEINDEVGRVVLLEKTGLGIQMMGYEPTETIFLAAHKPDGLNHADSIFVFRHQGRMAMWRITGDEMSRRAKADEMRDALRCMEKNYKDGKDIDIQP